MVDGHIHLERGGYTLPWLNEFVKTALERNIDEIHLLEHSHRFYEFEKMYEGVAAYSDYQRAWLASHLCLPLEDYCEFITWMRGLSFPVKISFGLEVCYVEGTEELVRRVLGGFDWDFVTGSVHWVDGFGFDHKPEFWAGRDVDGTYARYYEIMRGLIKSGLFDRVAHPDSIKCFGHRPSIDLTDTYAAVASLLNRHGMSAEMSAGLHNNYGCAELGMNPAMLAVFRKNSVRMITASDAHRPADVGRGIAEMDAMLRRPL